ncbi:hypothetical protein [Bradyrhizobium betae]|uniref:Uncharacterized protein n=1 Tax=Bradyrhizobium betae TaxID=244734 RepID=A0A5P6PEP2_9BRAD|nr:hypothetical protein [Bradyrhizobium betae]MCS3726183.1 hypothetical protein [Bradyrhizobium betae]QFI76741.1 hypothetical protein F8237_32680 [Bradyrhizobium betae]
MRKMLLQLGDEGCNIYVGHDTGSPESRALDVPMCICDDFSLTERTFALGRSRKAFLSAVSTTRTAIDRL